MARGILGSSLVRGPRTTGPLARSYRGGGPVQYYQDGDAVESPTGRERRQARRESFAEWLETGPGQDVMDRIRGLDLGSGQVFNQQVGPGRLSVNLPMEYGQPKMPSIADFLRDPSQAGQSAEAAERESAIRATYTIPIGRGGGGAHGGPVEAYQFGGNVGGMAPTFDPNIPMDPALLALIAGGTPPAAAPAAPVAAPVAAPAPAPVAPVAPPAAGGVVGTCWGSGRGGGSG